MTYSLRFLFAATFVAAVLSSMSYVWRVTVIVYAALFTLVVLAGNYDRKRATNE